MANFPRIYPDTYYVHGNPIPASYFQAVDSAQTAAIDGDAGGTWSPTSAIVVAGAGMWCCGPWQLTMGSGSNVGVFCGPTPYGPMVHGDNDYINIITSNTNSSRNLVTGCDLSRDASGVSPQANPFSSTPTSVARFMPDFTFAGGYANCTVPSTFVAYRRGGRFICPLRVHNGGQLTTVTFNFQISNTIVGGGTRSVLPTIFPQFRVHRVDIAGNLQPLGITTNGSGFFEMSAPGSVGTYVATTQFVYSCNQFGIVDTSKYTYFAEVIDEQPNGAGTGAVAGNIYTTCVSNMQFIPDWRPQ